ncbi:MAG: DUF1800 domain-containing protein [Pirellulaceae bacterium]|nr:DUF1800 domain-containing protein [Pirellulaceae bacterium]
MPPLELNELDPDWAWSEYEPDADQPWDRRRVAHLYRRAGFAASERELREALQLAPAELIQRLVEPAADETFEAQMRQLVEATLAGGDPARLASVWLYRMLATPDPLREKLTLFWHGHFATSAAKVQDAQLMQRQNAVLRQHALGRFEPLVQEISRDPAMLVYLDSDSNRKSHPNENYARELMELFCLGEGNYTEQDIRQLARCFTGCEVRRRSYRFNQYQHDSGVKTFLGSTGAFGGEEAVRVVIAQPAAARFLVRKLVHYLVCDEPRASDRLIEPLAEEFRQRDLDTGWLVRRVLGSQLFFSTLALGRKIRSPVELAVGLLRALEGSTNVVELSGELGQLGQQLFFPPNVKGWEGGRNWINSSTLLGRANLVEKLLHGSPTRFAGGTLADLAERYEVATSPRFVDWLAELLLAVPLPDDVRRELVEVAEQPGGDRDAQLRRTLHALSTLPEFQLA